MFDNNWGEYLGESFGCWAKKPDELSKQEMHWTGSRLKGIFTCGACLWIISGAVIYILPITLKSSMYGVASVIGLGNALMLVSSNLLSRLQMPP